MTIKLQQLKIKITRVNTKTADAIERTFQTTSAHTTKRIKMEWGWGRLRPVTFGESFKSERND